MSDLKKANQLYTEKKYEEALRIYEEIAQNNPGLTDYFRLNMQLCRQRIPKEITVSHAPSKKTRVAVFAGFSSLNKIEDYVVIYLKELRKFCNYIVYVCDNSIPEDERNKISGLVNFVIEGRHGEYDFGSYKRGFKHLKESNVLNKADWLLLCNDSCYGPIGSFSKIFSSMEERNLDFWGITKNSAFANHLQSYFISFSKNVFQTRIFSEFLDSVVEKKDVTQVVLSYEIPMTTILADHGFKWGAYIDEQDFLDRLKVNSNLTLFPYSLLQRGAELVKVKAFNKPESCLENVLQLIEFVRGENNELFNAIVAHNKCLENFDSNFVGFSVILPVKNGEKFIVNAINSVIGQNYENFELIIIDDGSTDNTESLVNSCYHSFLLKNIIKYIKLPMNLGVAYSRNIGLAIANKEWVAYLDADNEMMPYYFNLYSNAILKHPDADCFYSRFKYSSSGKVVGDGDFSYKRLLNGNFIDNGVFVHRNMKKSQVPCFHDVNLKRLIDWDFILSYCKLSNPVYINSVSLLYNDDMRDGRVSVSESYEDAYYYIRSKHNIPEKVTTLIFAYNHEEYIEECLESVVKQKLKLEHEIIFLDDSSTDNTWNKFLKFSKKYPGAVKGVRHKKNKGQAGNFKYGIDNAKGDYIALIEGDDYWESDEKLAKQVDFLKKNNDCNMVFSKIKLFNQSTGGFSSLERQDAIKKSKLDAGDFLNHSSMNLIANFSCCLFKSLYLKKLPKFIYEERITEIGIVFYFDKIGKIGYLNEALSVYRQHPAGLWTGANKLKQRDMAIKTREMALRLADDKWHAEIQKVINNLKSI